MNTDQRIRFHAGLKQLINGVSLENDSNTPDWMLADYLIDCLDNWNSCVMNREKYYGRIPEKLPVSQWPVEKTP